MTDPTSAPAEGVTEQAAAPQQAVTLTFSPPAPAQTRQAVHSSVAIFDTARFEHMGRVAAVMAEADLLPATLTHEDGDPKKPLLDFRTIKARSFMIVNQAGNWNMDPIAVAQGVSLVYNRLMYEGKLINAAVQSVLGIEIQFEYGSWDPKKNRFIEGERGEGELLAVRLWAVDRDGVVLCDAKGNELTAEGCVKDWKTTKEGSPWKFPSSWPRQLVYRGTREWARLHRPSVILGVYSPDDRFEDFEDDDAPAPKTSRKRDLSARLNGPAAGEGFDQEGIARTLDQAAPPSPSQADVVAEARQAGYEAAAQGAQDIPPAGLLPPLAAAWTGGYQDKVAEIAAAAAATDVVEPIAAAEPDPTPGWKVREDINGPAQPGVVYLMRGDVPDAKTGRLTNYKDGKPFSSVGTKGATELARYTMHPTTPRTEGPEPERVDAEGEGFPGDKPAPTEGSAAIEPPPVEESTGDMMRVSPGDAAADFVADEWEPLERNEGPAPRGVEYTLESDEIEADDTAQAYEDGEPTRRVPLRDFVTLPEYEAHPLPLEEVEAELVDDTPPLLEKLAKMTAWTPVKTELTPLYGDPEFKALPPEEQETVRANIWVIVLKIKKEHGDPVDPAEDPSAFRLWCSTQLGLGEEGANAIEGTFRSLKRSALFGSMSADNQKRLSDVAEGFVKRLKG